VTTVNPLIGYEYTVNPSDTSEEIPNQWKNYGTFDDRLPTLVGFQNTGVRNAYTKFLFYYDTLVLNWIKTFQIMSADEKEVIPVTNIQYGTPERLFAVDPEKGTGSVTERIILPAISTHMTSLSRVFNRAPTLRSTSRYKIPSDMTCDGTLGDFTNYYELKSNYHVVDLPYQIDLYTKYKSEMIMLIEQIMLPFGPHAYFRLIVPEVNTDLPRTNTNFPYDFDEYIMVHLTDLTDASDLEPGEGERKLRTTVSISLEAYIPIKVSKYIKSIKKIVADVTPYYSVPVADTVASLTPADVAAWTVFMLDLDLTFVYQQRVPALTWNVSHNLGKYPHVIVVDTNGNVVMANVQHIDVNTLLITCSSPQMGRAFLN
jgi:hypothetical protein